MLAAIPTEENLHGRYSEESKSTGETTQDRGEEGRDCRSARTQAPTHEEIQKLAQSYWAARGYKDGYAEQDWLQAEQELLKKAS